MTVEAHTEKVSAVSQIGSFYDGRSVFVTGATGFVGSVLLETLLRCCPGIEKIYILLREKKGQRVEDRKNAMLQKKIFRNTSSNRELFNKIRVLKGDVTEENIGISSEYTKELKDVSVVFHCAAVISFMKPLRYMIVNNVVGTENVVKFCRSLPNLVALIHASTAYSNSNIKGRIRESIYSLTIPPREIMEAAKNPDDAALEEMFSMCVPRWPNNYTFSKAVAEDFLATEAVDLPVAIVRPSIIVCCWKGSLPGYVEEGSGITHLSIAIGKGFVRVIYFNKNRHVDLVPVDIVANTLITASWFMGTGKNVKTPFVVNCTTSDVFPVTWDDIATGLFEFQKLHPLPKMYQSPYLVICRHWISYWANCLLDHYAPALCIDAALLLMRKKPKLTKMYMFYDKVLDAMQYFMENEWKFDTGNLKKLIVLQNARDSEAFSINADGVSTKSLYANVRTGADFYEWQNDKRSQEERIPLAQKWKCNRRQDGVPRNGGPYAFNHPSQFVLKLGQVKQTTANRAPHMPGRIEIWDRGRNMSL